MYQILYQEQRASLVNQHPAVIFTLDLRLVLGLFHVDIQHSEGFVRRAVAQGMDGGQHGSLGGYEDSRLAPGDWQTLALGLLLRDRGQALSIDHLPHTMDAIVMMSSSESNREMMREETTSRQLRIQLTWENTFGLKLALFLDAAKTHFLSGETSRRLTERESHTSNRELKDKAGQTKVDKNP